MEQTLWTRSHLEGSNERDILRQPLPVVGVSSPLELATESYYPAALAQKERVAREAAPGPPTRAGLGNILKLHLLKCKTMGDNWTRFPPKPQGSDAEQSGTETHRRRSDEDLAFLYDTEESSSNQAGRAGRSPLTNELLLDSTNSTDLLELDYDDNMPKGDREAAITMSNIPQLEDIEMQEADPALVAATFRPEFTQPGYDPNFIQSTDNTGPGSTSPITQQDDNLLESPPQTKAPGADRPGPPENTRHPIPKKK